ncbi:MAG: type II secretion system major pseudopilin GspG, partial [Candidatus Binatia bacterium]
RPSGYTLLEIMVVVFILGLLVTIVAPRIMGRTDEARVTAAVANMKSIEQALNLYRLDNGAYPTTEQGLEALVTRPTAPPAPKVWRAEGYLTRVPLDPWGNAFVYVLETPARYTLRNLGADGVEGGEGLDADIDSRAR